MQTPAVVLNIGVDVAKEEIVVARSESSFPVRQIANQRAALLAFLKNLPTGSRIGVESTGSYHELFAEAAHPGRSAKFRDRPAPVIPRLRNRTFTGFRTPGYAIPVTGKLLN